MLSTREEILSTKRFFQSHHISLCDYWLESCIQWYHEEHPNTNCATETLHLKVYAQWLLLDLRDVEVPVLPPNLAQQKKTELNGTFPLQMLHVVDISRAKHWQLQKLRNSNLLANALVDQENQFQNNTTGKRMLQLLLTDGVQEIEAIEYKPINVLHVNMTPGVKIRIAGPVTVRRGQMLLEEKHVNILGGEVEELLVQNAAENILARALNLPENPNPRLIEEAFVPVNENVLRQQNNGNRPVQTITAQQTIVPNNNTALKQPIATHSSAYQPQSAPSINTSQKRRGQVSTVVNADVDMEEELRIMAEMDSLLEAERDIIQERKRMRMGSPDMFDDDDITFRPNPSSSSKSSATGVNRKTELLQSKNDSIFEDMDIDAHLDVIDQQLEQNRKPISRGTMKISQLVKNKSNITSGKFTVRAKYKKVVQKLTVVNDAWSVKLLLEDDTGELEVYIHSDVISDLMGYSPAAITALKKDIEEKNQCATATIVKIIGDLKAKIFNLDCLMEVMFMPNQDCPTVVNFK